MTLRDLIRHLDKPVTSGSLDVEIKGLTYDSRKAKKGVAFFALRGTKVDGHDFIAKALEDNAAAIFAEIAPPADCKVPWIHVTTRVAIWTTVVVTVLSTTTYVIRARKVMKD